MEFRVTEGIRTPTIHVFIQHYQKKNIDGTESFSLCICCDIETYYRLKAFAAALFFSRILIANHEQ